MDGLISIIVPVYNSEKYLFQCLESIKNQSYKELEVIIINDGSTDNSKTIIDDFCSFDERFLCINQDNSGVSNARNKGLSLAKGKYIGFVDSDDYISEDFYETLLKLIYENDADISIVGFNETCLNNGEHYVFDNIKAISEMINGDLFMGHLHNKLCKRELFEGLFFDEDVAILEDLLILHRVFYRSKRVVFLNRGLYYYRSTNDSAMNSVFKDTYLSRRVAALRIMSFINEYIPSLKEDGIYVLVSSDIAILNKLAYLKLYKANKYKYIVLEIKKDIKKYAKPAIVNKFKSKYIKTLIKALRFNFYAYLFLLRLKRR